MDRKTALSIVIVVFLYMFLIEDNFQNWRDPDNLFDLATLPAFFAAKAIMNFFNTSQDLIWIFSYGVFASLQWLLLFFIFSKKQAGWQPHLHLEERKMWYLIIIALTVVFYIVILPFVEHDFEDIMTPLFILHPIGFYLIILPMVGLFIFAFIFLEILGVSHDFMNLLLPIPFALGFAIQWAMIYTAIMRHKSGKELMPLTAKEDTSLSHSELVSLSFHHLMEEKDFNELLSILSNHSLEGKDKDIIITKALNLYIAEHHARSTGWNAIEKKLSNLLVPEDTIEGAKTISLFLGYEVDFYDKAFVILLGLLIILMTMIY